MMEICIEEVDWGVPLMSTVMHSQQRPLPILHGSSRAGVVRNCLVLQQGDRSFTSLPPETSLWMWSCPEAGAVTLGLRGYLLLRAIPRKGYLSREEGNHLTAPHTVHYSSYLTPCPIYHVEVLVGFNKVSFNIGHPNFANTRA